MSLSVIVRTFNKSSNVELLIQQLDRELIGVPDADILFVDDSTDKKSSLTRRAAASASTPVRILPCELTASSSTGAVVSCMRESTADWIIVMDGDQHPPAAVPALYERAVGGTDDVIVATHYTTRGDAEGLSMAHQRVLNASSRAAKLLFPRRLAKCSDPLSGFFAVRRDAVHLDAVVLSGRNILLALLLHRQLATSEIPFQVQLREPCAGRSKASFREDVRLLWLLALLRVGAGLPFALVGASGTVVNLVAIYLLVAVHINDLLAAALAVQVAIAWNFVGAELFVFHDRRGGKLWHRGLRYLALGELDLLRLPFVALLVHFGMSVLVSTVITLFAVFVKRYLLASRFIYGKESAASTVEPALVMQPASPRLRRYAQGSHYLRSCGPGKHYVQRDGPGAHYLRSYAPERRYSRSLRLVAFVRPGTGQARRRRVAVGSAQPGDVVVPNLPV